MFGRRFTKTGWLQLGALVFAVASLLFLAFAPVTTVSVNVDLPPSTAGPGSTPEAELFGFAAVQAVGFVVIGLAIGLAGMAAWLTVWTARKIIRAQPKSVTKVDLGEV